MQLAFDYAPITVVDGPQGTITYHPACIAPQQADAWLHALLAQVPWQAERRWMYDREVDVPRLTAHYALDEPLPAAPLAAARSIVERLARCTFTAVGLNLYRDGRDSVAPHNDKLHDLEDGAPIALLSLGATRTMTIRTKQSPRRRLDLDLDSGSVLIMSYETQRHFDHGIPKVRVPIGPRISLAFRRRRAGAAKDDPQAAAWTRAGE